MAAPPFKVKALYEYNSGHEDDLAFPENAIITVTAEEDADWYVGEYSDPNGTKTEGLFPKNFVERYEPAPPPRPNRASRPPPPPSAPAPVDEAPADDVPEQPEPEHEPPVAQAPEQPEAPREERPVPPQSPPPVAAPKSPEQPSLPKMSKPAPPPAAPAAGSKSPPPPVAEKPQSFKDRIAAFNRGSAAPIAPLKPGGPPSGFIKKPFVAPPPSRNAYVPPPREPAPQKVYRRDEDPEISERQAQDQEMAERAGLGGSSAPAEGEEDAPKPQSLKERIALLQKQQMEQAARQAEASHKEKPKRPPKKRIESHEMDVQSETTEGGEPEDAQAQAKKRHSHHPKSPEARQQEREPFSDGNEADQSAAGETTEDAEGSSTSVEEDEERARGKGVPRAHAAPTHEPEVGDEEDATEEEAEEEMDEETKRRMELRERMAKLSGGMGMAGMFGMPMPGMKPPPKKTTSGSERKSIDSHRDSEQSPPPPAQRVPMIPIPGMGMPQVRSPESEDTEMAVEKENEPAHPITGEHEPEKVTDMEDIKANETVKDQPHEKDAPPPVPQDRPVPPPPSAERPAPPPVPADSRPVPAPPPPERPESRGSESDEELPARGPPPPIPQSPPQHRGQEPTSPSVTSRPSTSSEKRASRPIPPIPGVSSPVMSPTAASRAPPPPPPAAAPPSRGSAKEALSREDMEGETEYEGDYDTDIASGATHKDALKAHARDHSYDESTLAGSPITGHPPVPSGAPRAVPPPPPQQPPPSRQSLDAPRGAPPPPPRESMDAPRGAPPPRPRESMDAPRAMPPPLPRESIDAPRAMPPPPPRESIDAPRGVPPPPPSQPMSPADDEDEYDPYKYNAQAARAAPPPPSGPPPAAASQGSVPEDDDDDDEEIYQSPPPRRMSKRMSQHQAPFSPHQEAEDTYETPMSPPRSSMQTTRKSLDVDRTLGSRRSMDQSRPSIDHGHIANDVDLGQPSQWWTQPNTPPPVFQNRKDVLFEIEESTTSKRGGRTIVQKDVYVLFQDYSQTVVTARYDTREPAGVALEQRHEPPPQKLRQDQLEDAYEQFGRRMSEDANAKQHATVGDGSPQALVLELLKPLSSALYPVGTRAYGALVYANLANASVQQNDEIRPGDIISLRNAKFEGKHGAMHAKYKMEVGKPDHVGVVVEWDGTKKKIRALEQGRESKKVKVESFRMGDLRSGEVRVWRVMGRDWVGWDVAA
ncbi:SH3 domain-containing protein [Lasiodiplodia theobromae]|uniref:SH3 domain-containing protein n=1 Tax=Lasiodiplodia theobromae TaxID=45133 RepID=A0A5N5DNI9_9PEZI|nr:SH3 domain-containing protein [Lasiodiplodia theobromae]